MSDSENIIDGKVIPYSGGRMHTDTSSWRDATDMELEQQKEIEELQAKVDRYEEALKFYADGDHYKSFDTKYHNIEWTSFDIDKVETGMKAREALGGEW